MESLYFNYKFPKQNRYYLDVALVVLANNSIYDSKFINLPVLIYYEIRASENCLSSVIAQCQHSGQITHVCVKKHIVISENISAPFDIFLHTLQFFSRTYADYSLNQKPIN